MSRIQMGVWLTVTGILHSMRMWLITTAFAFSPLAVVGQPVTDDDPFRGEPLGLRPQVEIRAMIDGGPELTMPRSVLADSLHIYVLDPASFGVHRFDRAGAWLSTIGAEGDGPGEFRRLDGMGWRSDTLWVSDGRLARLSFFDRDGVLLRSVRLSVADGSVSWRPSGVLGARITGSFGLSPDLAAATDSIPIAVFDEDGTVADTLAWRITGRGVVSFRTASRQSSLQYPFDRRGLMAFDPRRRWLYLATWRVGATGADRLELVRITAAGDTAARMTLPLGRIPVSARDVRSYARAQYEERPERMRSGLSVEDMVQAFLRHHENPSETHVDAMIASEEGTLWLRKTDRTADGAPQRWAGYEPDAGFLGFVQFPPGHQLLAAADGLLWTRGEGAFGLPTITGWEIARRTP